MNKTLLRYFSLIIFSVTFSLQNALALTLELPIDCKLGENCWITNLPRHFYENKEVDYKCGSKTYPGHKGTDFILEDIEQMKQGFDVLSPFDGIVKSIQDGIKDNDINLPTLDKIIEDQECGNNVVVVTDDFEAQLCHMEQNSISVKVGDQVSAGERLGSVGVSGKVNHPQLSFIFNKRNLDGTVTELDPFYGDQPNCGLSPRSLWTNSEYLSNNTKTGIVYNYGIAFQIPDVTKVRSGYYKRIIQPHNPEMVMVFADILSVDKGHKMKVQFLNSEGKILFEKDQEFTKYEPRYFFYIGKNLHKKQLHGNFNIKIIYTKPGEYDITYNKEVALD